MAVRRTSLCLTLSYIRPEKTPMQRTDKTDKSLPFVSKWHHWESERTPPQRTDKTDKSPLVPPFVSFVSASEGACAAHSPGSPPPALLPCAICGDVPRWSDMGIWRCRACWPTPLTAAARRAAARDPYTLVEPPRWWADDGECFSCHGALFWHSASGVELCLTCHPPPDPALVASVSGDNDEAGSVATTESARLAR